MSGPALTSDIIKGPPPPPVDRGWGGGDNPEGRGADRRNSFTGLVVLLISTFMVFGALVCAFVARKGMSDDWVSMHKPPVLWANTVILLVSSYVLDLSRRSLRAHDRSKFNLWWSVATGLGFLFLVGQAFAWFQLANAGIFVATNPSSSFFYVLSAAHAAHVVGGLAALVYVDVQALRLRLGPAKRTIIDVSAIFWHFLDALWMMLMVMFYAFG